MYFLGGLKFDINLENEVRRQTFNPEVHDAGVPEPTTRLCAAPATPTPAAVRRTRRPTAVHRAVRVSGMAAV